LSANGAGGGKALNLLGLERSIEPRLRVQSAIECI
jgi:hypothetical protein